MRRHSIVTALSGLTEDQDLLTSTQNYLHIQNMLLMTIVGNTHQRWRQWLVRVGNWLTFYGCQWAYVTLKITMFFSYLAYGETIKIHCFLTTLYSVEHSSVINAPWLINLQFLARVCMVNTSPQLNFGRKWIQKLLKIHHSCALIMSTGI